MAPPRSSFFMIWKPFLATQASRFDTSLAIFFGALSSDPSTFKDFICQFIIPRSKYFIRFDLLAANYFLFHFSSKMGALEVLLTSPFRFKNSLVFAFKFSKVFSLLNTSSISLPIHLSLPFVPAKFKCLLFGLLSNLGEVLDIEDDFNSHFSPHVKACILWNLVDALPSRLNIFDGDGYYAQSIHFGPLPSFCSSCRGHSSRSCAGTSSTLPSFVFQTVVHKRKSPRISSLSLIKSPSGFVLPILGRSRSTSWLESSSKEACSPPSSHMDSFISDYCRSDPSDGPLCNRASTYDSYSLPR
ncbi:hypothetical protein O6H91_12G037600 [Diphasiastrum complanatum]|uniref:Uncharacterized protein n=1 Tax=Diphasiastrum complanatum TaxID=34168 RepID=A0ACC2C0I9_DIPCM|nr:hypothetical protein O6H91_12G037600 [Diphasiastrum complanatum]